MKSFFKSANPPVSWRKDALPKQPSTSSGSSAASASATADGGGSSDVVCTAPSSVAKLTSGEPQPQLLLSRFGGMEGGTSRNMNMDIPLAQKWLPENTHTNPLDGSALLLRQLERLSPVFLEYESRLRDHDESKTEI